MSFRAGGWGGGARSTARHRQPPAHPRRPGNAGFQECARHGAPGILEQRERQQRLPPPLNPTHQHHPGQQHGRSAVLCGRARCRKLPEDREHDHLGRTSVVLGIEPLRRLYHAQHQLRRRQRHSRALPLLGLSPPVGLRRPQLTGHPCGHRYTRSTSRASSAATATPSGGRGARPTSRRRSSSAPAPRAARHAPATATRVPRRCLSTPAAMGSARTPRAAQGRMAVMLAV